MGADTMKTMASISKQPPEPFWKRVLFALPLLFIFLAARAVLSASTAAWIPTVVEASERGWMEANGQHVPIRMVYSGFSGLDAFLRIFVVFFTPCLGGLGAVGKGDESEMGKLEFGGNLYATQRLQSLTFLADFTTVVGIFTVESCRRGNKWSVASVYVFPSLFPTYSAKASS